MSSCTLVQDGSIYLHSPLYTVLSNLSYILVGVLIFMLDQWLERQQNGKLNNPIIHSPPSCATQSSSSLQDIPSESTDDDAWPENALEAASCPVRPEHDAQSKIPIPLEDPTDCENPTENATDSENPLRSWLPFIELTMHQDGVQIWPPPDDEDWADGESEEWPVNPPQADGDGDEDEDENQDEEEGEEEEGMGQYTSATLHLLD